ncbi:hypothetical protein QVD17_15384 [Tagetes erecta]|uniref:Uncharacterized protein n=1 Tax=Tagetes erecta TaxID=13708 RepID=A0AAD8NSL7_TARER|nr:hypothetical protein QVD17_15384 [Tagetes erecta]
MDWCKVPPKRREKWLLDIIYYLACMVSDGEMVCIYNVLIIYFTIVDIYSVHDRPMERPFPWRPSLFLVEIAPTPPRHLYLLVASSISYGDQIRVLMVSETVKVWLLQQPKI